MQSAGTGPEGDVHAFGIFQRGGRSGTMLPQTTI